MEGQSTALRDDHKLNITGLGIRAFPLIKFLEVELRELLELGNNEFDSDDAPLLWAAGESKPDGGFFAKQVKLGIEM